MIELSIIKWKFIFLDPRTPVAISATPVSDTEILYKWKQPVEPGQQTTSFIVQFATVDRHRRTFKRNITKSVANEYTEKFDGLVPVTRYSIHITAFKVVNGVVKRSRNSSFLVSRTLPGDKHSFKFALV